MMKKLPIVQMVLGLLITSTTVVYADTPITKLSKTLVDDPIIINGRVTKANKKSNCGMITEKENQIIEVKEKIDYLRISVESQIKDGEPTLLIDGPIGKFCLLFNKVSGQIPEISGVWLPGKYKVYVGDMTKTKHSYKLYITQQTKQVF